MEGELDVLSPSALLNGSGLAVGDGAAMLFGEPLQGAPLQGDLRPVPERTCNGVLTLGGGDSKLRWFAGHPFRQGDPMITINLVLLAAVLAGASPTEPVGKDFKVGKADLEISLHLDKPEIMVGEPVFLSFQVKNRSDQDLQSIQFGYPRSEMFKSVSYHLTVKDVNDKALPLVDAGWDFGGPMGPEKIPAKGTWVRRLFLPEWVKVTAASDYTITCKTTLKVSPYTTGRWDEKEKTTDLAVEVQAKEAAGWHLVVHRSWQTSAEGRMVRRVAIVRS